MSCPRPIVDVAPHHPADAPGWAHSTQMHEPEVPISAGQVLRTRCPHLLNGTPAPKPRLEPPSDQTCTVPGPVINGWIEGGGCGGRGSNPSVSELGRPSTIVDPCYLNGGLGTVPCAHGPFIGTNAYASPSEVLVTHSTAGSATGYAGGSEGVYQEGDFEEDVMIYYHAALQSSSVTEDLLGESFTDIDGQEDGTLWPWEEYHINSLDPLTVPSTHLVDEKPTSDRRESLGDEEGPVAFSHLASGWTIHNH